MPKRYKVYLPPWIRWMILPILALIWGAITYEAFFTPAGRQELDWIAWALISGVLLMIGGMIWAMSSGKLPAYIMEDADEDK